MQAPQTFGIHPISCNNVYTPQEHQRHMQFNQELNYFTAQVLSNACVLCFLS